VVHREDILRASSDLDESDAARVDAGLEDAVFEQLRRCARALGRNVPSGVGVLLRSSRHGSIDVRRGRPYAAADDGCRRDRHASLPDIKIGHRR
jgi:hypothetical protein